MFSVSILWEGRHFIDLLRGQITFELPRHLSTGTGSLPCWGQQATSSELESCARSGSSKDCGDFTSPVTRTGSAVSKGEGLLLHQGTHKLGLTTGLSPTRPSSYSLRFLLISPRDALKWLPLEPGAPSLSIVPYSWTWPQAPSPWCRSLTWGEGCSSSELFCENARNRLEWATHRSLNMPFKSRKDSHESRLTYTLSISSWVRAFKPEWLLVFSICAVGQSLLWNREKAHNWCVCGFAF